MNLFTLFVWIAWILLNQLSLSVESYLFSSRISRVMRLEAASASTVVINQAIDLLEPDIQRIISNSTAQKPTAYCTLKDVSRSLIHAGVDNTALIGILQEALEPITVLGHSTLLNFSSAHFYPYLAALAINSFQPKPLIRNSLIKPNIYILYGQQRSGSTTVSLQLVNWITHNSPARKVLLITDSLANNTQSGTSLVRTDLINHSSIPQNVTLSEFYLKLLSSVQKENYDSILIDLPSRPTWDEGYLNQIKSLKAAVSATELLLTLDAQAVNMSCLAAINSIHVTNTTGIILSKINQFPNSGLVFSVHHFLPNTSFKFESKGLELTDFGRFNPKDYVYKVFGIQNETIFREILNLSSRFGPNVRLSPELLSDARVAANLVESKASEIERFLEKSMQYYECLTEQEKANPEIFMDDGVIGSINDKKLKMCKKIAQRKNLSYAELYCIGILIKEYTKLIYSLFEPVRKLVNVERPASKGGFGMKQQGADTANQKEGFDSVNDIKSSLLRFATMSLNGSKGVDSF